MLSNKNDTKLNSVQVDSVGDSLKWRLTEYVLAPTTFYGLRGGIERRRGIGGTRSLVSTRILLPLNFLLLSFSSRLQR